jgi:hypothetical protein
VPGTALRWGGAKAARSRLGASRAASAARVSAPRSCLSGRASATTRSSTSDQHAEDAEHQGDQAWQQISETVLQHQGTVYPATAAAAPFLCRIALDEATLWRATLAVELAFLSAGYDEPYAPAGTAQAVRDAVRPYVGELMGLWGTDDQDLDMALVLLSVAFPVEAAAIASQLRDWFGRSEPQLRTALQLSDYFDGRWRQSTDQIPRLTSNRFA